MEGAENFRVFVDNAINLKQCVETSSINNKVVKSFKS